MNWRMWKVVMQQLQLLPHNLPRGFGGRKKKRKEKEKTLGHPILL